MEGVPRQPAWRNPAVLLTAGFLLVLLLVQVVASGGNEKESALDRTAPSPAVVGVEGHWPNSTGIAVTPGEHQATAAASGRTFIAKLNLQPRLVNGHVKGFVVRPDDPSILQGTPLQTGDVLLEVDGLELDMPRAALLEKSVGEYQDVFVRFERDSAEHEEMLPLVTP